MSMDLFDNSPKRFHSVSIQQWPQSKYHKVSYIKYFLVYNY